MNAGLASEDLWAARMGLSTSIHLEPYRILGISGNSGTGGLYPNYPI